MLPTTKWTNAALHSFKMVEQQGQWHSIFAIHLRSALRTTRRECGPSSISRSLQEADPRTPSHAFRGLENPRADKWKRDGTRCFQATQVQDSKSSRRYPNVPPAISCNRSVCSHPVGLALYLVHVLARIEVEVEASIPTCMSGRDQGLRRSPAEHTRDLAHAPRSLSSARGVGSYFRATLTAIRPAGTTDTRCNGDRVQRRPPFP